MGSGNNFAKHDPAGPHSFSSVQVRRQIGRGVSQAGGGNRALPQNERLTDLRRLLLNRFFDGGWLPAGHLVLVQLGWFGPADARPCNQSSENRVPDVHDHFDHQAHPCPEGFETSLAPLQGENAAGVPE